MKPYCSRQVPKHHVGQRRSAREASAMAAWVTIRNDRHRSKVATLGPGVVNGSI
jgi:hypothetical protein